MENSKRFILKLLNNMYSSKFNFLMAKQIHKNFQAAELVFFSEKYVFEKKLALFLTPQLTHFWSNNMGS